jgi:hypothetical protein
MKMEQTECSETSAYKIQTPGNYPEENIQPWNDFCKKNSKNLVLYYITSNPLDLKEHWGDATVRDVEKEAVQGTANEWGARGTPVTSSPVEYRGHHNIVINSLHLLGISILRNGFRNEQSPPATQDVAFTTSFTASTRHNRSTSDHIFCIRRILEETWEYNKAIHQLFIDFNKA